MLSELIRRFRGFGIAIVVLAMSAGLVFAAAPPFVPASSHANPAANPNGDATESPSEDATESPSEDATESPSEDATESPATDAPTADTLVVTDTTTPSADTHGALVSAAAQMAADVVANPALDPNFRNRGAFVSCVAHMKDATGKPLTLTGFLAIGPTDAANLATDLPAYAATQCLTTDATPTVHGKSEGAKTNGQDKSATGKAKGQAKAAAARSKHQQ